jgi:S-layer protein
MSAVYNSTVQGFYLSYYGRPADPAGLTFWTGQLAAAGGNLSAILNAFGTSAEATRRYGTGTTESKIQAVYQQTFGRAADAAGLAFYNTEITAGRITLIDMSKRIIDGATGDDVAIRNNRLSAAQSFTDKLDTDAEKAGYSGSGAEDAARAWVATVTKDAATVTAAVATADSTITSLLPQTFTLTANQDKWTGSAGNDTVAGGATTLSSTDTLGATDQIDGGAGTDTANFTITKNFNGFTVGTGFMKGVENVNLTNSTTTAVTFTARAVEGVASYDIKGPVSVTGINSLSTGAKLSDLALVANNTDISVNYADEAVTGSSDKATVSISGLGRAGTASDPYDATNFAGVNLYSTGVESLTLSSAGANHIRVAASTTAATTGPSSLVHTGSGSLVIERVGTSLKTFDGSEATGVQTVRFTNATNMTSVKTGSANDQIRAEPTIMSAVATIDGGAGTDTLRTDVTGGNITAAWTLNNIETLSLNGTTNGLTLAPTAVTGLSTITVATAVNGTNSITNLGAIPITVSLSGPATGGTDANGQLTVANIGGTATLTAALASGTTSGTVVDDVTFSEATSVTLSVPAGITYAPTNALIATKATAVTLNTAATTSNFTKASAGTDTTRGIEIPAGKSLTIDHKGTGAMTLGVGKGSAATAALTDLTVTNVGTVTLTTPNTGQTGAQAFANLERLTVNTESLFYFATGTDSAGAATNGHLTTGLGKASSVTLSGTKDASAVTLGALGGDIAYGTSLTASGLKGGLTVGAAGTAAAQVGSGQTISVDISGKTGVSAGTNSTFIGAMSVGAAAGAALPSPLTGTISVSGKNATDTGNLTIDGNIFAGTVSIDLSGSSFGSKASGTLAIARAADGTGADTITGNSVTIKTGTPTAFHVGNIVAKDAVVFHGPSTVAANAGSVSITAHTGSTGLTVDLQGSLAQDQFTITGIATNSSIKVTGDLKQDVGGNDMVTIDGTASTASGGQTIDVSGLLDSRTTITGSTTGADTILGSPGVDTITARGGADLIDISQGGSDVIVLRSPQDSGAVSTVTSSTGVSASMTDTTVFASGSYVGTSTLDKITGFAAGDTIQGNSFNGAPASVTVLQKIGSARGTAVNDKFLDGTASTNATAVRDLFVQGNYDASANRFTFSDSGRDTLYLLDADGTAGGTLHGVVLIGYVTGGGAPSSGTGLVGGALPS